MSSLGAFSSRSATLVVAGPSEGKGKNGSPVGKVGVVQEGCRAGGLDSASTCEFSDGFVGVQ